MRITRSFTILVLGVALAASPVLAQPTASPSGSNKDKDKDAAEDESLYSCGKKTGDVVVSFKPETELKDLITWVMGFTCKTFVLNPSVVATSGKKVTIIAPLKQSPQGAYRLFLVALSTMNLTVVPKGNVMRIVESATAKSETLPIYKNGAPPDDDEMVRTIYQPTYAQPETLRTAFDSIRSTAGTVAAAGNLIIITDYGSQVRDMLTLAKSIDIPGNNEGVYTIPVLHSDATQLATKLNEILGISPAGSSPTARPGVPSRGAPTPATGAGAAPAIGGVEPGTAISKILVDDRTNTLIVVGSEPGYLRVKSLVERLDILLDTEGGAAIRVYSLKNALAKDLATTLNNALSQNRTPTTGATGQRPGQAGAPPPPTTPAPAGDLGASLEGQVRVTNDDPTNSLIVMSSGRDYLAIKNVIQQLDQPRRQVFIEALVLEVTLEHDTSLGTASHGGLPVSGGQSLVIGGVESSTLNSLSPASSLSSLTGLLGGIIGSPLTNSQTFLGTSIPSYAILFQALATLDNTQILSAPHVIALDNEKEEFSAGNNIPYTAGLSFGGLTSTSTTGSSGTSALPVGSIGQNIQREDLTLELNVTPHISGADSVRLEVEVNDKDLGTRDPQLGPTWTERKLKTQVVVHDQESVVIGGLIQDHDVEGVTKVPLLGDIPILGYLFKYRTTTKTKTDLLILLTPYIIKDQLDLQNIRERKLREYHEFTASFAELNEAKYEPKIDYRRKRGLVEEINRALESVEEDQELLNAAGHRQHVNEGAVEFRPSDDPEQQQPPPAPPKDGH
jgi:general secretion pathway protein D